MSRSLHTCIKLFPLVALALLLLSLLLLLLGGGVLLVAEGVLDLHGRLPFDQVGQCDGGDVQQDLDVQVVGSLDDVEEGGLVPLSHPDRNPLL